MSELHCDPGFQQLLAQHFPLSRLEQHADTIYGLWPDLRLAYMNPAWFRYARENGANEKIARDWKLGRIISDALPDVLHPFYVELYLKALENRDGTPLVHEFECSSTERYVWYEMELYALGAGAGLLIINHERITREHSRYSVQPDIKTFLHTGGYYRQCSHCRCYQSYQQRNRWDWIPDWLISGPGEIEHTLCPTCFDYYYSIAA